MTCRCAPNPSPLYFIEHQFRSGRSFLELDRDSNSRAAVIALIRSGEVNPVKVLEVDEVEGSVRDVTEELLSEAMETITHIRTLADEMEADRLAAKFDRARELRKETV